MVERDRRSPLCDHMFDSLISPLSLLKDLVDSLSNVKEDRKINSGGLKISLHSSSPLGPFLPRLNGDGLKTEIDTFFIPYLP